MDKNQNPSIGCVVNECKYHAQNADYCTLDKIMVGRNESFSNKSEDTDCESFISKNSDSFK